jgi:MYXO-CTERM domain-containing protein
MAVVGSGTATPVRVIGALRVIVLAEGSDPLDANSIPVPEPASAWLALAALMTLLGLRRSQKRLLAHDRRAASGSGAG